MFLKEESNVNRGILKNLNEADTRMWDTQVKVDKAETKLRNNFSAIQEIFKKWQIQVDDFSIDEVLDDIGEDNFYCRIWIPYEVIDGERPVKDVPIYAAQLGSDVDENLELWEVIDDGQATGDLEVEVANKIQEITGYETDVRDGAGDFGFGMNIPV